MKPDRQRLLAVTLVLGLTGILSIAAQNGSPPRDRGEFSPPPGSRIPVAFVVTEGSTVIDFAGPWEAFQDVRVNERGSSRGPEGPFDLYLVGEDKTPVEASSGMTLTPRYSFDDAPPPKVVVVGAQRGSPKLLPRLRKVASDPNTDVVMSVCTGAYKLARAGLLDGKEATTHHDFYDDFTKEFPSVRLKRGLRFVRSGPHLFTAGGLTSGVDLALHVVSLYFGEQVAAKTAAYMEYQGTGWRSSNVSTSR